MPLPTDDQQGVVAGLKADKALRRAALAGILGIKLKRRLADLLTQFEEIITLKGIPGPKGDRGGPKGDKGDASTVPGPKGDKGDASTVPGPKGDTGPIGKGVPKGGDTGEVLAKKSKTDFDTHWVKQKQSSIHIGGGGGGGGGSPVRTKDEGATIQAATKALNFIGAGVTATSDGAGGTNVTIPGGGGGSGVREVYSQSPDPAVTLPSINFVPGEWADPDIYEMKVFIP